MANSKMFSVALNDDETGEPAIQLTPDDETGGVELTWLAPDGNSVILDYDDMEILKTFLGLFQRLVEAEGA